ncbi:MBL fold metallo-hydrolase [Pseudoroseicyclus sp. CXY001]|uniref:MBL fold metallo-hydrolase n=1 Tax=Pseudoroseicyclus sp. CXY001 TaxID=3242492 RepID=UPI003570C965
MRASRPLTLGMAAALAALPLATLPLAASAQPVPGIAAEHGEIAVWPIRHASLVLQLLGTALYADPVGGAALYEGLPPPALILITNGHGDHLDPETLTALAAPGVPVVAPAGLALPEGLTAHPMAAGDRLTLAGAQIEAIPAENTSEGRLHHNPPGTGLGYVITLDGARIYIAGDTEATEAMLALTGIDAAFLPMSWPDTMSPTEAAAAAEAFRPAVVYPYHYWGNDIWNFSAVVEAATDIDVRVANWY